MKLSDIGSVLAYPFKRLKKEAVEEIFETGAVAFRGALSEAPMLDDLLDGKEIIMEFGGVSIPIRLRRATEK